jgi:hypothetical protein
MFHSADSVALLQWRSGALQRLLDSEYRHKTRNYHDLWGCIVAKHLALQAHNSAKMYDNMSSNG